MTLMFTPLTQSNDINSEHRQENRISQEQSQRSNAFVSDLNIETITKRVLTVTSEK